MHVTLHWFLCLCLEKNLLDASSIAGLRRAAKADDDAIAYSKRMLERGILTDRKLLVSLLDEAFARKDSGENPPFDPFQGAESAETSESTPPTATATATATADSTPDTAPGPNGTSAPKPPPNPEAPPPAPSVPEPVSQPSPAPSASASASASASDNPTPARPNWSLIAADSIAPALPDFDALEGTNDEVRRKAMIALLRHTSQSGASDLHLSAGARPFVRRDRENHYLNSEPLSAELAEGLNRVLLSESQWANFEQNQDFDFALPFSTGERYRANLMIHKDGCAGTYRTVDRKIRTLSELGFRNTQTIDKLLAYHNGLIIVAGPVGSGKTTTLAALVQQLNQSRDDHLISVEEPIEFVHQPDRCIITQRGVNQHTQTFHSALKGALRQDPDIIVIGEMRDLETVEMAISASETGHLVIGTMHTSDAATTLNRLLDVFPPAQQPQIRAMVGESLRGIICQRLLPAKMGAFKGGGVVLATEILLRNTAVSTLIREGKTQGLGNVMETGKSEGMMTMDSSVLELWREGKLSDELARANIRNEVTKREIQIPLPNAPPNANSPGATPAPAPAPEVAPKKRGFFNRTR